MADSGSGVGEVQDELGTQGGETQYKYMCIYMPGLPWWSRDQDSCFYSRGIGSIPAQVIKIPHAVWCGQKKLYVCVCVCVCVYACQKATTSQI